MGERCGGTEKKAVEAGNGRSSLFSPPSLTQHQANVSEKRKT